MRADTRHQFDITLERFELAGGDVRLQGRHRGLEIIGLGRRFCHVVGAQPVIGLLLLRAHHGVGKHQLAVSDQPADVVGVHVGDVDFIDLLGRIAGRLQVGGEFAKVRSEVAGRASVDQHQLAASIDQEGIERGFQRRRHKIFLQGGRDLGLADALQQGVDWQRGAAIVDGGDFKVAQHHAVVGGGVGLDERRGGEGGRAGDGHRGGGDGRKCETFHNFSSCW